MAETFEILIVGAGIVGAACAAELATHGASVAVLERDTIGSGATAAGMGHVVVMDDSPAQLALTRYSQQLWDELAQDKPEHHEYMRCGTLWVAADAEELAAIDPKQAIYRASGIPTEALDTQQLYECEPNLRSGLAGGLLVPSDSVVYPPRTAALLMQQAQNHGARLVRGEAIALVPGGVALANGTQLHCSALVLANGAAATRLACELPIRPKKGHLAITDRYPNFVRHQLVELGYIKNAHAASGDSVAFNVQPRPTGQVLIGSSRQFDTTASEAEPRMLASMLNRALEYLPGLAQLSLLRVWTGFRAATPDGLPLIGPHPERPGVWLATGHEGLGITTSLGTAKLLAAQLLSRPPEIPFEPYLPSRAFLEEPVHA